MLDHYQGTILGSAIGDALGRPTEFLSLVSLRQRYGPDGITDLESCARFPAGTYTDDTQMTIALAEGLLAADPADLEAQMTAVAERFVDWLHAPDNDRAPGNTCLRACRRLAAGTPWRDSGEPGSKGCGSVMRTAPVGLLYHRDPDRLAAVADAAGCLTHRHPCARAATVAMSLAVSLALDHAPPDDILEAMLAAGRPFGPEFGEHLCRVRPAAALPPDQAMALLGEGWVAEEALAAAWYCFARTPEDYVTTVLTGANTAGDSDSIAAIAGALSGAFNGLEAIPERWRETVENSSALLDLARRLHARNGVRHRFC